MPWVAGHRYRINKIKRMHSIVHGLLPILEDMARHPAIAQITPGRISGDRHADDYNVTMQYFTESGMKLIARTPTSVQEVFIVTSEPEEVQAWLISEGLIEAPRRQATDTDAQTNDQNADAPKTKQKRNDSTGKSGSQQRSKAKSNQNKSGAQRRNNRNNRRAAIADKYGHEPTDVLTDLPTDALLFSDYLSSGTAAKLRQLREQIAAQSEPTPTDKRPSSGQAIPKGGKKQKPKHVKNSTPQAKSRLTDSNSNPQSAAKSSATTTKNAKLEQANNLSTKTSKKETNLLEVWLKQADDETFKRLSRKFKGHDK